ncbi:hypothetical protein OEA41_004976 [Lepraria neglecta]|uniref:Uncharacterized protein n=1 Tax=Lepraria neglecta TaxID=209136 RepID=A0AAD9Z0Y8_9LECA|nr:hypothetical protein OEA41_004976 [Lepraria neglecta]
MYGYLIGKTFRGFYSPNLFKPREDVYLYSLKEPSPRKIDLAILWTSKLISQEGMSVLNSRALFLFRYDVSSVPDEFEHPSESLTDRIMNVEIIYKLIFSAYDFDDEELEEPFLSSDDLYKANARPINLFRDSDVPRDNIRVELRYCTESTAKIISSPLFDAMKEFTISRMWFWNSQTLAI